MFQAFHKFYRAVYRVNRATRTAEAISSGKPRRVAKLFERRAAYSVFARILNRLLAREG